VPICQTEEEKYSGVARLFCAKTRNETSGKFVYTKNDYEHLSIKEIDRKMHARLMTRAGFQVPDDTPKGLRRIKGKKELDSELEDHYDDA